MNNTISKKNLITINFYLYNLQMFSKLSFLFAQAYLTMSLPLRENVTGGCVGTQFGCCNNSVSPCLDVSCSSCPNMTNANSDVIGGCVGTQFGCCNNSMSPCLDVSCSSCPNMTNAYRVKFV